MDIANQVTFSTATNTSATTLGLDPEITQDVFDYYPALAKTKRFVEQNLCEKITLAQAAEAACLEAKYFSTFFRVKTGIPFSHWLVTLRLQIAIQCLGRYDYSITRVALESGFQNLRAFERAFKKHIGITPISYKKNISLSSLKAAVILQTHE